MRQKAKPKKRTRVVLVTEKDLPPGAMRKLFSGLLTSSTMHLPTSDPEHCLAIEVRVLKTKEHHFDRKGKPLGYAYNDADAIWFSILRLLPEKMWEDLLVPLAVAMDSSDIQKLSDTQDALELRKALKGKMTSFEDVMKQLEIPIEQLEAELLSRDPKVQKDLKEARRQSRQGKLRSFEKVMKEMDDEPTVIGTDPKIKFARLREKARVERELTRYVTLLNKHGDDSKQDKAFILDLILRGDGDLLVECNMAKLIRSVLVGDVLKEVGKKCPYPHSESEVCVICRPHQKKAKNPEKTAERSADSRKSKNEKFLALAMRRLDRLRRLGRRGHPAVDECLGFFKWIMEKFGEYSEEEKTYVKKWKEICACDDCHYSRRIAHGN